MNTSTVITMLIGTGLSLLVALVTKENLPAKLKVLILLLLSTASGVVSGLIGSGPTSLAGWGHVAVNILLTFVTAAVADYAAWNPLGTKIAIEKHTARFGIGPRETPVPSA